MPNRQKETRKLMLTQKHVAVLNSTLFCPRKKNRLELGLVSVCDNVHCMRAMLLNKKRQPLNIGLPFEAVHTDELSSAAQVCRL